MLFDELRSKVNQGTFSCRRSIGIAERRVETSARRHDSVEGEKHRLLRRGLKELDW